MGGVCGRGGGGEDVLTGFGGELEGKEALGRPNLRWGDNINMGVQEWDGGHGLD
jgi:hypothetical protein